VNRNTVQASDGSFIVHGRNMQVQITDQDGNPLERYKLQYGAKLHVDEARRSSAARVWPNGIRTPCRSSPRSGGKVKLDRHHRRSRSVKEDTDEATGIASKRGGRLARRAGLQIRVSKPAMVIEDKDGEPVKLADKTANYMLSVDAILSVNDGDTVQPGDVLARIPTEGAKTKDITGGLPRVAELFEARRPKDHAIIAEIDRTC
jgi:DNA-directed RNA polymerase subunit beta'